MSHDFLLWKTDVPLEDSQAAEIYHTLLEGGSIEGVASSGSFRTLAQKLKDRWPDPTSGNEDVSPWASPLEYTETYLSVTLVPSRLWDVWPYLSDLAKEYELVMFDPQQACVFLPTKLSRKRTALRAKRKKTVK